MPANADDRYTVRHFSTLGDYAACVALQDATWGAGFAERVPGAILQVAQKLGGVAAGAFDADGELAAFVFGMSGPYDGTLVHWSDMLAVRPADRGQGLGEILKRFQRDTVMPLGIDLMLWTADPLVARNAHFNVNRLGAVPAEYVENLYGEHTGSILHGAMPTDRAIYRWSLRASMSFAGRSGAADASDATTPAAITINADGVPIAITANDPVDVLIPIPHDLSHVQARSAEQALAWRMAVRSAFSQHFTRGMVVTRFVRGTPYSLPYYVLSAPR